MITGFWVGTTPESGAKSDRRSHVERIDKTGEDLTSGVAGWERDGDGETCDTFIQPQNPGTVAGPDDGVDLPVSVRRHSTDVGQVNPTTQSIVQPAAIDADAADSPWHRRQRVTRFHLDEPAKLRPCCALSDPCTDKAVAEARRMCGNGTAGYGAMVQSMSWLVIG
jgi:hypothetical protein